MRRRPELVVATLIAALAGPVRGAPKGEKPAGEKPTGGSLFDIGGMGSSKEPITIVSDTLDYDYKNGIAVYRGNVQAVQGEVKLVSDTLRITFEDKAPPGTAKATATTLPGTTKATTPAPSDAPGPTGGRTVKEVVADGNVRMDQGTKYATGGHAVFEQTDRTVVLTQNPVMHDGKNEVAGDRVVVYLDEDRSVVEGGRKRVKAVLYPDKDHALTPQPKTATASDTVVASPPAEAGGR